VGGRCRIVWAVTAAIAVSAGCSPAPSGGAAGTGSTAARAKGAKEAAAAIAAGTLTLKEYPPLPYPPEHQEYVKLLRERCGVGSEVPRLPAGVPEADFIEEVRGWNDVMEAAIKQKHGVGIFEEQRAEAGRRWREQVTPGSKQ
jgi:hypothetical protein